MNGCTFSDTFMLTCFLYPLTKKAECGRGVLEVSKWGREVRKFWDY